MDIVFGATALTKLGDKRAIPVLEQFLENFGNDSRWTWEKNMARLKLKYPNDFPDYKHLERCLKALKAGRVVFGIGGKEMDREKWLKKRAGGAK